jgi:inward rectifier potassium channel
MGIEKNGKYKFKKQDYQDLGIGTATSEQRQRFVNRNGEFNIVRRGLPFLKHFSAYHELIAMSWTKFNLLVVLFFVLENLIFGAIYMLIGTEHIAGATGVTTFEKYLDAFFMSTQSFTTVGYGRLSPVGTLTSMIATIEALAGLMTFALMTGLLYGRFSRPTAKILFSENAVIAPYQEGSGFMFRIANQRDNQLIDVTADIYLAWQENVNGKEVRRFHNLTLERTKLDLFSTSWTIVHPIDVDSPMYGVTRKQLDRSDAEFVILIKAFDDTFAQTVHARTSYKADEVIMGAKFTKIIRIGPDGRSIIDLDRLSEWNSAKLPEIHEIEVGQELEARG